LTRLPRRSLLEKKQARCTVASTDARLEEA